MTRSKSDLSAECTKQYGYCRRHSHTAPAAVKRVSAPSSCRELVHTKKKNHSADYSHG